MAYITITGFTYGTLIPISYTLNKDVTRFHSELRTLYVHEEIGELSFLGY